MYKYHSFAEYMQMNYIEEIQDSLSEYLSENILKKPEYSDYNKVYLNTVTVRNVNFTKNRIDRVEFLITIYASYVFTDVFDETKCLQEEGYFCTKMQGSFKDGFKGKAESTEEAEEQAERLTSGLVPIISNSEMDSYATKFLQEFCPEAIETPMKLKVEEMLRKKGIAVHYAPLGDDVFGKTYFAKDKAVVYLSKLGFGEQGEIEVEPGTILINLFKHLNYPDGVYRNTIVHEAVHWYFHRNFFELRLLLNPEETHVTCSKGNTDIFDSDTQWMEWQARSLAPRILMPKKAALKEYDILLEKIKAEDKENGVISDTFDVNKRLLKAFAAFFGVSKESAKIRMIELGKKGFDGIENYVDGDYIKPFEYNPSKLKKHQTYIISLDDFLSLLQKDLNIKEAIRSEKLLYINKMLVVNNPKYVSLHKYEMTRYALDHVDECCVPFDIQNFNIDKNGTVLNFSFLCSGGVSKFKEQSVNPEALVALLQQADTNGSHFEKHRRELPPTFEETLEHHYSKAKENRIISSYEDLEFKADVSRKTIQRYRYKERKPERIVVLKLALALQLSAPYILDLLNKADLSISNLTGDNMIYMMIIYSDQRKGLEAAYKRLEAIGKGYLLELSDEFKKMIG